ncbi:MAG: hypothetical protein FWD26_11225 [Treponema sp.]|nr:hypothetical protein [Treponema sp.]
MRRIVLVVLLFLGCLGFIFPQSKPRLGILPFTGGSGQEGETIAALFSHQKEIENAFTIVPRTNVVNAMITEQNFQMSGYTDSDTIARIGRMLNADFVVSGHIRRLGRSNLIIATIVNVETFEQLAGDYRVYRNIEDVRSLLPVISAKMVAASRRDTSRLPRLAIAPFSVTDTRVNAQEAETLAHILAVEIANIGMYAVLPRTTAMLSALRELNFQMQGATAEEGAKALGRAINAEYVLSAEVRRLGNMNIFTAQILHVEDGRQLAGDSRDYRIIDDGIYLMEELAQLLNGRRSRTAMFRDPSRFWSVGVSAGTSFSAPWIIGSLHGTISPFKYQFVELGIDYGMISGNAEAEKYYSFYPYIHYGFFIPFKKNSGCFFGAGAGYMTGEYTFPEEKIPVNIFAFDAFAGINIGNLINITYTLRTNFNQVSNKLAVGIIYRFK